MRILWTVFAIVVGGCFGIGLSLPIVGAPHAFPGLLLDAPESIRTAALVLLTCAPPAIGVWWVWRKRLGAG